MVRKHETSMAWKAGLLAVLVHLILVSILLFSFQWKAAHTVVSVSEVELWDRLPSKSQPMPKPVLPMVEPKPEPPKPQPEVKKEPEPQVEPEPEQPKVDIELENKKKKEAEKKKLEEKKKAEEEKKKLALENETKVEERRKKQLEAIKKAALDEELDASNKAKEDALKKLQQMNDDDLGGATEKASIAASQGIVDQYIARIQAKVRGNVNKSLCADGNPEPKFRINLLPNGEFSGSPTLTKSSGNKACDDAVERAIIASEPFPLPEDPSALARFRELNLTFKPNEN